MVGRRMVHGLSAGLIVLGCAATARWVSSAEPARAQAGLRAQVFLTQAKLPAQMKGGLIGFAKKNGAKRLLETKESDLKSRKWMASLVLAFNRPPDESEVNVLFYDVHEGSRKFVEGMNTFLDASRKEKVFLQSVKLERPRFRPNRKMELVVTVRQQEVGSMKFDLIGEEPKRSGVVNFSDEDARQRD